MKNTNQHNHSFQDMDQFIGKLQKEDQRNVRLTRAFQWIMWSLAALYMVGFVISFRMDSGYKQAGWMLYILAMLLFGFIFNYLKREYLHVDYGVPTLKMLEAAAKRYKLFQRKLILAITPVLLIDAGMVLLTFNPEEQGGLMRSFLHTQAMLIPAFGVGLIIGICIWRKRQKPLRDAALEMIDELNRPQSGKE